MKREIKVSFNEQDNCWEIKDNKNIFANHQYRTKEAALMDALAVQMESGCELTIFENPIEVSILRGYHQ